MKTRSKILTSLLCATFCVLCLTFAATSFNGFTAQADETPALTVTMAGTASVRKVDPVGIRFETTYSGDFSSGAFDGYSFGTLVIPTDLLNGELTKETAKAIDIEQLAWASQSDNSRVFYAVLANIPENASAYARDLTARSYYRTDEGEYVYSSTTVERSIAKVASLAINDGDSTELLQTFVKAVATGVSLSESQAEMVVGGKYTLSATTAPSGYGVYWRSDDEDIATVDKNGKVTAVSVGTTTITAEFGDYSASATVTVKNHIEKDGSEMLLARQTNSSYEKVAEGTSVGGREGVYKFDNSNATSGSPNWNDRIHVYESSHAIVVNPAVPYANSVLAYRGMAEKNYNFVSIDVYFESGAGLRVSSINSDGTSFLTNKYFVGSQIASTNSLIKIYQHGAEVLTTNKIYPGMWYTIVVDRKNSTEPTSSNVWSAIDFAGCYGVTYFDKVRYYYDDRCYTDYGYAEKDGYVWYDGSEFVVATSGGLTGGYYALSDQTVGGRTGVYELNSTATGWKDKIGVYAANHMGTSVFSSVNNALNNMLGQNYKYVTFDIYIVSGGIAVSSPEYTLTDDGTSYTAVKQTYKRIFGTWGDGASTKIKRYKNGTLTDSYSKNEWYTVVVEYQAFANYSGNEFHGVDISAYPTSSEKTAQVYIDNVRYYSSNPFED